MSSPMSFKDLEVLLQHVYDNHSPYNNSQKGKVIKYIDPHVDMRDGKVFAISFRTFGAGEHCIHTQNECHELGESLFERCISWLKEPI